MAQFTYTARDARGALKTATIDAQSKDDVVAILRRQRMNVIKIEEAGKAPGDFALDLALARSCARSCARSSAAAISPARRSACWLGARRRSSWGTAD